MEIKKLLILIKFVLKILTALVLIVNMGLNISKSENSWRMSLTLILILGAWLDFLQIKAQFTWKK